jgi:hypothetical protein
MERALLLLFTTKGATDVDAARSNTVRLAGRGCCHRGEERVL